MLSHPIFLTIVITVGFLYISGACVMLFQIRNARAGYEDEEGFHFSDPMDDVVVPADEIRPSWFTGALAERFASHRIEIFAGATA